MSDDKRLTSTAGVSRLSGSFWTETYDARAQTEALFAAVAELAKQYRVQGDEAIAAVSRTAIRPYRRERWAELVLKRSELNTSRGALLHYGTGAVYGAQEDGTRYQYGVSGTTYYAYPAPAGLRRCTCLGTRINTPGRCWTLGVDVKFDAELGLFLFRDDPLADPHVARLVDDDDVTALLWICDAEFEHHDVYQQYGFVHGFSARQDSLVQKPGLNAVADCVVGGTSLKTFTDLLEAGTGIPKTQRAEIVEDVSEDAAGPLLLTDRAAYRLPPGSTIPWSIQETIPADTFVTTDVIVQSFSQPQVPDWLHGLALTPGIVAAGFVGGLVLYNADVEVQKRTVGGRTRVAFDVGGSAAEAKQFFDEIHARGATAALSFWDALELEYGSNPTTINPLAFFVKHWFRGSLLVVRLAGAAIRGKGWTHLRFLKQLTPPNLLLVVLADLRPPRQVFTIPRPRVDRFLGTEPQLATLRLSSPRAGIRAVTTNCE
jgi:hypothetical protein